MEDSSLDELYCNGRGIWNGSYPCECDPYWITLDCRTHIWNYLGAKFWGIHIWWIMAFSLQLLFGVWLLLKHWSFLRRFSRASVILIMFSSVASLCYHSVNLWSRDREQGCFGNIACPLADSFFAFFYAGITGAFLVLVYEWASVVHILYSRVLWFSKTPVKVAFLLLFLAAFAGAIYLFVGAFVYEDWLQAGSSASGFLAIYYFAYGAIILIAFASSGIPVFRFVGRSKDSTFVRFTALLFLESATSIAMILNSLLLYFGYGSHNPSLYLGGHIIMNNVYRFLLGSILLVVMRPGHGEREQWSSQQHQSLSSDSAIRLAKPSNNEKKVEGYDSSELFSTVTDSGKGSNRKKIERSVSVRSDIRSATEPLTESEEEE